MLLDESQGSLQVDVFCCHDAVTYVYIYMYTHIHRHIHILIPDIDTYT